MKSKTIYEEKKKELLSVIEDDSLDSSQKLDKIKILELLENLEVYQTELNAQNKELIEKEHSLMESRDEFEKLFSFAPIAYLQLDKDFKVLKHNTKALELFEQSNLSFSINNQLSFYIYKEDMINYINFISTVKKEGFNEGIIRFINKKDFIYGRVHMKKYEKERSIYYLISIIDITIEVKQEAMILSQSKSAAMGEMLEMITHQWKQPLAVIGATNSLMTAEISFDEYDKEKFSGYLSDINEQLQYMTETADDFKSFLDENKKGVQLNVKNCISRAIRFTSGSLRNSDIKIDLKFENDEDEYTSFGFKNDICQILITIINNAKDALINKKENKRIDISIYKKNSNIILAIKNNGGIINENIISSIFNQSFTTKTEKNGSGLGLYIARKIACDHLNGDIYIKNLEKEDAVVFYLEVPQYIEN